MKKIIKIINFKKIAIWLLLAVVFCTSFVFFNSGSKVTAQAEDTKSEKDYLSNTVIFLSFSKSEHNFPENFYEDVYAMYESADVSVRNYFLKQSLGKLTITTDFLLDNGNCIRTDNPIEYYQPRYEWASNGYVEINEVGYDNRYFNSEGKEVAPTTEKAKRSIEGIYREQMLIREIAKKCKIPSNYDNDLDKNEIVDSLVIITDVNSQKNWGDILWSHMSFCHTFQDSVVGGYYLGKYKKEDLQSIGVATLGGNQLSSYNMISLDQITSEKIGHHSSVINESEKGLYNVGMLCHEMMHNVGLYDYYSYEDKTYESVGEFDLMGSTDVVPQYTLSYLREKLGWLGYENALYINDSGNYTLYPVNSEDPIKSCKIILNDYLTTGEFFMAEVRSQSLATSNNPFDGELSGNGLIIYRVNKSNAYVNSLGTVSTTDYGNMYGDDEVYVYRMGNNKKLASDGISISYALLGNGLIDLVHPEYDHTTFGNSDKSLSIDSLTGSSDKNKTIISYTNGHNSGIVFSNVKLNEDGSVSFHVQLPENQGGMPSLGAKDVTISRFLDGRDYIYWNSNVKSGVAHVMVLRSTDRLKSLAEKGKSHIEFKDFESGSFSYYTTLYSAEVPLAEKSVVIPKFNDEALVFIALQAENGNKAVRYIGCIPNPNESFGQYVIRIIDPLYTYVAIIVLAVIVVLITLVIVNKHSHIRRRK